MFYGCTLFPDFKFGFVAFEVWISLTVESGPCEGPEGQPGEKQAPVLLNGPIMAWIRRNVFMEPCY